MDTIQRQSLILWVASWFIAMPLIFGAMLKIYGDKDWFTITASCLISGIAACILVLFSCWIRDIK